MRGLVLIVLFASVFAISYQYTVHDKHVKEADKISNTYIKPSLKNDKYLTLNERATLLRLDVLLSEIISKRHPQTRTIKIIEISNKYVELNKKRNTEIDKLLKELKELTD